jgi:lysozyme family protein
MARESFGPALTCVLAQEGGYSDHPDDPGGATMMGITRATLAAWRGAPVTKADVRALARDEAAAIYRARYWNAVRGGDLPAGVDLAVFDFAVNSGASRAIRSLQRALGVTVDGLIGPETMAAANARPASETIRALCAGRRGFVERLSTFPVFGRGWTRRIREVEATALKLALPTAVSPKAEKENTDMDMAKTILSSRTIWANAIGMGALALSWLGFDTSGVDKSALTDHLLQALAGLSFVASTFFRVIATKRLA